MEWRRSLRRVTGVVFLCLFCFVLQSMVLNRYPLLGGRAKPAIAAVVVVAVLWGPAAGVAAGFLCGLCCDALLPGEAFFTVYLSLAGLLSGLLTRLYMERRLSACLLWGLPLLFMMEFLYFATFFWLTGRAGIGAFWQVGVRDALLTFLCIPPVYPLLRRLWKQPTAGGYCLSSQMSGRRES